MTDDGPQFLIAPEPQPGADESPGPARNLLRRRLGVGAVLLVGTLLVGRAVSSRDTGSHDTGPHGGAPTTTSVPDTAPPATYSGALPNGEAMPSRERAALGSAEQQLAAQAAIAAHCPPTQSCVGSDVLPGAFLDAVRDDLGTVLPSSELEMTDSSGGTLQYRQLVATGAGGMKITLTVTRTGKLADGSVQGNVSGGKARVYAVVAGYGARYRVELTLDGPPEEMPPFQVLQGVVTDARLL